jgi:threonine/homoserine/homoserine lactone efflux protein
MDSLTFIAGSLALLAMPGPTNTLLAASGAEAGLRRSAHLLAAELAGYLLAILLIRALSEPLIAAYPGLAKLLQGLIAAYVAYLALRLWRRGAQPHAPGRCVTFPHVFATTLLNPKAAVFALVLLPAGMGPEAILPRLGLLSALIATAGLGWVMLGAALQRRLRNPAAAGLGYRAGSVILLVLAVMTASRHLSLA